MEPRKKANIFPAIIIASGIVLAAVIIVIFPMLKNPFSQQMSTPTSSISPATATFAAFNTSAPSNQNTCPTSSQVAQSMGVQLAAVMVLHDEPCAFKLDANFIKTVSIGQVHCPRGLGMSSVEMERVHPDRYTVLTCTGNDEAPLQEMYNAVVRFLRWQPDANACTICQQHYKYDHNIDCPPNCSTASL